MTKTGSGREQDDFEDWLGRELQRTLGPVRGPSPRASQAAFRAASRARGGTLMAIKSGIVTAVTSKAAAGAAALAVAAGGGAAVATAATGSANPTNWGQAVVQAVQGCKQQVRSDGAAGKGSENVGRCVSAFARQHGEQQRSAHAGSAPSPKPTTSASTHGRSRGSEESAAHAQVPHPTPSGIGAPASTGPGQSGADHGQSGGHDADHGRPSHLPSAVASPPGRG